MKIININQIANTHFNARFKIGGDISDIKPSIIDGWEEKATKIGSSSDRIVFHIGKKEEVCYQSKFLGLFPQKITLKNRFIFAMANINNKHFDKNFSFISKKDSFNDNKYLEKSVDKYLDSLAKIKK